MPLRLQLLGQWLARVGGMIASDEGSPNISVRPLLAGVLKIVDRPLQVRIPVIRHTSMAFWNSAVFR